jgi:hypothetical protein
MSSSRFAGALVLLLVGCGDTSVEGTFTELAPPRAPEFVHVMPQDSSYYMPESIGSGLAFLDVDGDGDLDIYAVNGASSSVAGDPSVSDRLFRQDGDTYVDVTDDWGLVATGFGMGVAVGDVNNDGRPDVFVTNVGRNALYLNTGDRFVDVTEQAGVGGGEAWSASTLFLDYDADGWLDLFVVNYLAIDRPVNCSTRAGADEYCGPTAYPGAGDFLYRNLGDGTFEDVTIPSGVGSLIGRGLGAGLIDVDSNGLPDLYVANDGEANFLWRNLGDGTFEESAIPAGAAVNGSGTPEAGMGIAVRDLTGDGNDDLFVTHLGGESNTLYSSLGDGSFVDETVDRGLHAASVPFTGFGVAAFDLENDGDADVLVANGRINRRVPVAGAPPGFFVGYSEPNLLFLNDGSGGFAEGSSAHRELRANPGMSRGLAVGDMDNDGGVDAIVMEAGRGIRSWHNGAASGNWLGLSAIDPGLGGRDVIGARVFVWYGDRSDSQLVAPGSSFLSSNDPRVHFGIGSANTVDSVSVRWPGGTIEAFGAVEVNRWVTVERGTGEIR